MFTPYVAVEIIYTYAKILKTQSSLIRYRKNAIKTQHIWSYAKTEHFIFFISLTEKCYY